jgi:hypothetical protein
MSKANAERRALPIELAALAERQGDYIFIEGHRHIKAIIYPGNFIKAVTSLMACHNVSGGLISA